MAQVTKKNKSFVAMCGKPEDAELIIVGCSEKRGWELI
jgi:hypothetical protein